MTPAPPRGAPSPPVRIGILDEYPVLVDGLCDGLDGVDGLSVVLRATTGAELLEGLASRPCDVVVVEPWLRSDDGISALEQICASMPAVTIVAFSRVWDESRVNRVMALGARAYVPKSTPMDALPAIIRSSIAGMVTRPTTRSAAAGLTPREIEVLGLAADGLDNVAIGKQLFITERTVKFHLQNAYRKLGAGNRTEAAALARRQGLLS